MLNHFLTRVLDQDSFFAHQSQPKHTIRDGNISTNMMEGAANLGTRLPCSCLNCHLSLSQCFLMQQQGICSSLLRTSKPGRFFSSSRTVSPKGIRKEQDSATYFLPPFVKWNRPNWPALVCPRTMGRLTNQWTPKELLFGKRSKGSAEKKARRKGKRFVRDHGGRMGKGKRSPARRRERRIPERTQEQDTLGAATTCWWHPTPNTRNRYRWRQESEKRRAKPRSNAGFWALRRASSSTHTPEQTQSRGRRINGGSS